MRDGRTLSQRHRRSRLVHALGMTNGWPIRTHAAAARARLAAKLREGAILGHVDAHERLGEAVAPALVRWVADGATR